MKKNILIIDDSALMRRVLSDIINSDERFEVSKFAGDGVQGLDYLIQNHYDCTILDINMPKMNGLELLEQLKKHNIRTKVLIVSTVARQGANETIRALELGAFDFITKPESLYETRSEAFRNKLLNAISCATQTYSLDAEIMKQKMAKRTFSASVEEHHSVVRPKSTGKKPIRGGKKLIALACSTGGPKALQTIVPLFPKELNAPIVVVQHMPAGFTYSLAVRLNETSKIDVKEAAEGDILENGKMYIAKGGNHLKVRKSGAGFTLHLGTEDAVNGLRPCADIMYRSLCDLDYDEIVCVVLTGMGSDGTKGIQELSKSKNIYVIAQDMETSIVYGMPKAVFKTGLVDEVRPLNEITESIVKHVGVR